jgi:hypothetical protein
MRDDFEALLDSMFLCPHPNVTLPTPPEGTLCDRCAAHIRADRFEMTLDSEGDDLP